MIEGHELSFYSFLRCFVTVFVFLHLLIEKKRIKHKFYQLMKSSPWNYITNITHMHMEKSMNNNESIPVTITHVYNMDVKD
jgi:hypothetical protein